MLIRMKGMNGKFIGIRRVVCRYGYDIYADRNTFYTSMRYDRERNIRKAYAAYGGIDSWILKAHPEWVTEDSHG